MVYQEVSFLLKKKVSMEDNIRLSVWMVRRESVWSNSGSPCIPESSLYYTYSTTEPANEFCPVPTSFTVYMAIYCPVKS